MPDTETPFLKLIKPEISGSPDTWGNKLNTDMDKIDVGVKTSQDTAGAALYRGRPVPDPDTETAEQKRTASDILLYADTVDIPDDRPGVIPHAQWVRDLINAVLPVGSIILWYGTVATIPAGWILCSVPQIIDGVTHTPPDLRKKFVVGTDPADPAFEPGDQGGYATHEHTLAINGHALTVGQMPKHKHLTDVPGTNGTFVTASTSSPTIRTGGQDSNLQLRSSPMTEMGNNEEHNHTGKANAHSSLPPYYALCYIMKIKNA